MKTVIAAAIAALVMVPMTDASAKERSRTKWKQTAEPRRLYDDRDRWYPNNADRLKIGSRIWWDQMEREGRLGGGGERWR
jgi:hypothetical protein